MALRMGLDPNHRKHRFDFNSYGCTKAAALMDLRGKLRKEDYPHAVVEALLLDMYPLELAWTEISACFAKGEQCSDFDSAMRNSASLLRPHQNKVQTMTDSLLTSGIVTGGISFEGLCRKAVRSAAGDNTLTEDLEYSAACFGALHPVFCHWAALGLLGLSKGAAYQEIADMCYSDDARQLTAADLLDTYEDASGCFGMTIAGSMGGGSGFPGAYRRLPPLW